MNLFKKIIIGFLLASILPITAFGFLIVNKVFDITKNEAFELNSFIARQIGWQLDTYFESVQRLLESLSLEPEMRDFDKEKVDELLKSYHASYTIYYGYQTVFQADPFDSFTILDGQGRVRTLWPFDEAHIGQDYSGEPFFQVVSQTKEVYFSSSISASPFTQKPIVEIAFPVFGENGEVTSIIKASIKLESVTQLISQVEVGQTGHLFIINKEGTFVAHPEEKLVSQHQNLNDTKPGLLSNILESGPFKETILYPLEKPATLIAYSFSNTTGWIVVLSQSLPEVLATPLAIRNQFIMILSLVTIFVALAALYLSRGITLPIRQLTQRVIDVVVKEDLDTKIDIKTGDEIEELALSFNQMMRRLREKTAELEEAKLTLEIKVEERTERLEELNRNLETIVEERTKELQEKVDELNKWYKLTVGRELRMIELKEEIKKLEKELKKKSSS